MSTMDEGLRPTSSAEENQVAVHIERERVAEEVLHTDHHQCSVECGADHFSLSAANARRLCCDASVVIVLEKSLGDVLNVGRRTRTISPSIRRALQVRDGGCRFPGCCESRYLDAHHVQHWCDDGETKMNNLVLLYRHHLRLLHQEGYEIVRSGDGLYEFVTPDRRYQIAVVPQFDSANETVSETLAIEQEHDYLGLVIDSRTAVTLWQGERMDYNMTVGAMMTAKGFPLSTVARTGIPAGSKPSRQNTLMP